jgi:hypothetical protein
VSHPVVVMFSQFAVVSVLTGDAFPFSQKPEPILDPHQVVFDVNTKENAVKDQNSICQCTFGGATMKLFMEESQFFWANTARRS